jgi:hypothetical protein
MYLRNRTSGIVENATNGFKFVLIYITVYLCIFHDDADKIVFFHRI